MLLSDPFHARRQFSFPDLHCGLYHGTVIIDGNEVGNRVAGAERIAPGRFSEPCAKFDYPVDDIVRFFPAQEVEIDAAEKTDSAGIP